MVCVAAGAFTTTPNNLGAAFLFLNNFVSTKNLLYQLKVLQSM